VRIPFPVRIPLNRVAIFAAILFVIQQCEGTAPYFSAGCTVFIMISAIAFNIGGGLSRVSGIYVFLYSTLVVIVGLCYKAYLGEPAESNLLDPHRTIEAYVGGITVMFAAVYLSRKLSRKTGMMENVLIKSQMYRSSIGCIVLGFAVPLFLTSLGPEAIRLQKGFAMLDLFVPLGILIGVLYEIQHSNGTRSVNFPVVFAILYCFFSGVLSFSKQGMLNPLVCWLLPVCTMRYRLSMLQIATCLLGTFILFHYLVPYSQYGRGFIEADKPLDRKIAISLNLLEHPVSTRKKYFEGLAPEAALYYNKPQGFWDRLQFISVDDGLINATDQGKVFGLWPVKASFLQVIPHVIWPHKPDLRFGNTYTHEFVPNMPQEDTTTGISYSAIGEAYHWAKWPGVLIVAPLIWFLFFVVFDALFGDLRATPWGLLVILSLSHIAPEGMISGLIFFLTLGAEAILFSAACATWIAPYFAIAVLGPERRIAPHPMTFNHELDPPQRRPRLWSTVSHQHRDN
jgi:hypothetical protein